MCKMIKKYNNLPVQVKASFWFLICGFLQKGISMITTPIFTRILTTTEFGQYTVFNSWLGIVTTFVSLQLSMGVFSQGLIKFEHQRKKFASSIQFLSTCLVFSWTVIYLIGREFWNGLTGLTTVQMMAMLVIIWSNTAFEFWASEQRVLYRYKALVIVTLMSSLMKPTVGIIMVMNAADKVTARILGLALVNLVAFTGLHFVQMLRGKQLFSKKFWKHALLFNLPLIPHYLSQTVLAGADRIMISSMVGDAEAGIYGLANSLSHVMVLFNSALMQTLSPWIYQNIKRRQIRKIASIAYSTLILIAAVNLLLIIFAPEAVALFAPVSYQDAIWVVPPLAMNVFFTYSYDLYAKFAFYYEKTKFIMAASVLGAILNVGLNYIFIGIFGYLAAGYTSLICYIIYCIGHYYFMNRVCDKFCEGARPYELRKLLKITISFLVCGFLILLTYESPLLRYSLIAVVLMMFWFRRKKIIGMIRELIKMRQ